MNLASDRFFSGTLSKGFTLNGKIFATRYHRYTYESKNKIYDVDVRDNDNNKTFHINCGFEIEANIFHKEIIKHFNL